MEIGKVLLIGLVIVVSVLVLWYGALKDLWPIWFPSAEAKAERKRRNEELINDIEQLFGAVQTPEGKRELADAINTVSAVRQGLKAAIKGQPIPTAAAQVKEQEETSTGLDLPVTAKYEHTLILAGTGHGKTQLLGEMILEDIEKPHSIVVFDSQGDLINKIMRLKYPRQNVVIIDPTDIEHPISLGLFDFKNSGATPYERERQLNSVIELLSFVLNSLLDSQLTSKQDVALRFVIRLCMVIPDATIQTLRDILSKDGFVKYQGHVEKLSKTAQQFFREEFHTKQFTETREQILRRVYSILENQTLERIFSSPRTKLDMRAVLDNGSIVLVNTAKSFLKEEGSAFMARFMVAIIAQAIEERDESGDLTPTFIYIDEAAPVIDTNITDLLETARKYKAGLTLAFQHLGQVPADLQQSILSNTTIKCIGGVSAKDARALKDDVNVSDPAFLSRLKKLDFRIDIKGISNFTHTVKPGALDRYPKRTDLKQLIAENRAKYCVSLDEQEVKGSVENADDIEQFNKST